MFLCAHRVDTSKRKLMRLSFDALMHCTNSLMALWRDARRPPGEDLDDELLRELRELRYVVSNDRTVLGEQRDVCRVAFQRSQRETAFSGFERDFKSYVRSLFGLANGLSQRSEVRDLFIDTVEKLIEPLQAVHWSPADVTLLYETIESSFATVDALRPFARSANRFLTAIRLCLLCMWSH